MLQAIWYLKTLQKGTMQIIILLLEKAYKKLFNNLSVTHCINDIMEKSNDIDFVISLYNRFPVRNSEIFISSLCEYYHIPYLGATPNIRAIAEDKHIAKGLSPLHLESLPHNGL